ncbi:KTSC domain-containing protein [Rummeliibacillus sp. POC4]|uniref:KTSC domain-containing protein n=1 Tax=Rummeliibacillus sp. POC4 TaxID=2305899 RepID=UPI000E66B52E|nr:KTSC domain-containing protein [Rummeliibacillus sp. POC4]RIJ66352.1 KTSC domain-containing protein [Rummeliibacillus sp. POC4]
MEMKAVTSSKLASVGYNSSAMILRIEFIKDGVFEYYGVPELYYKGLMEADSPGRYFKQFIKDKYRFVRLQSQS